MTPREITIRPVLNGFIVNAGCQVVVFTSPSELASAIERYYKDPAAVEKEFVHRAVNRTMNGPCVPQPPMPETIESMLRAAQASEQRANSPDECAKMAPKCA